MRQLVPPPACPKDGTPGTQKGTEVDVDRKNDPKPVEGGSRTVYLVTPVTYDASRADDEEVAQAFDRLVKDGAGQGALDESGVASVGFCVIQPNGDEVPLGIEPEEAA